MNTVLTELQQLESDLIAERDTLEAKILRTREAITAVENIDTGTANIAAKKVTSKAPKGKAGKMSTAAAKRESAGTHKVCRMCSQRKPISEFAKHNAWTDGYDSHCKLCRKKKDAAKLEKKGAVSDEYKSPEEIANPSTKPAGFDDWCLKNGHGYQADGTPQCKRLIRQFLGV